ncbi:TonB-dependent receptor [Aliikangiella sp. IMCC44359]|uniref:TonB-dependent receptor n=1 Tax=Aliikangiella sp. IMCC44359 TaxID=3459125 RepID=UPI00403ABD08
MKEFTGFRRSLIAAAISASMIASVNAANNTSSIIGTVLTDNSSTYSVTVKDVNTGRARTLTTAADGSYRFSSLPVGLYEIVVKNKDGDIVAEETKRLGLGSNTIADFDLSEANGSQTIQIVGSRVAGVDTSSMDSGLVVSEAQIDLMPVARNATAVQLLAAGTVSGDSKFGVEGGAGFVSFGGSSIGENSCYINGLEVTNTRQGIGCGSVPFEFYKEFQVKTGGYSAQFGRTTGGVLNAVTKSGGNEWEFAATADWTPEFKDNNNKSYRLNSTRDVFNDTSHNKQSSLDFTLSASGALIEDTLFVYAIVNPRDTSNTFAFTPLRTRYNAVDQLRTIEASGGDNLFWGVKLDWELHENHRLSYFGYSDRSDSTDDRYSYDPNTGTVGALIGSFDRKRGGEVNSFNYTGYITDDLTVTALYGEIDTEYTSQPTVTHCPIISDNRTNPATPAPSCGAGGNVGDNYDSNNQIRLDIEYALDDHLIRAGYDYQDRQSRRTSDYVGGHSYTYLTLAPNAVIQGTNGTIYTNNTNAPIDYVSDRIFSGGGDFSSELTAYYIEDEWQITDDLVLTIGARKDAFVNTGTTGVDFVDLETDWAPRLGFSWDVAGDGESKLYGTFGRYYLPVPNNTNYRAAAGVSDTTTYYTFTGIDATDGSPTGIAPINGSVSGSTAVNSAPVAPSVATFQAEEAEPFFKEEFILGYERELAEGYTGSVRYVFRDVGSALDDYCGPLASPASCTLVNPGEDGTWSIDTDGDGNPDPGSKRTYTAAEIGLPDPKIKYESLQFEVKSSSEDLNWTFVYTWSRSIGNFEGALKSDINQADAGLTQDWDFPALMDGAYGYLPNDRRHGFKFFGSYSLNDSLSVGWNSSLTSGRPLSSFGQGYPDTSANIYGSYGDTFYLYTNQCPDTNNNGQCDQSEKVYIKTPRGSAGRTPWLFNLDLSLNYDFEVSGVDMRASFDVYNVLDVQEITSQNEHYEARRSEGTFNEWYGAAYTWQAPRSFGVSLEARF